MWISTLSSAALPFRGRGAVQEAGGDWPEKAVLACSHWSNTPMCVSVPSNCLLFGFFSGQESSFSDARPRSSVISAALKDAGKGRDFADDTCGTARALGKDAQQLPTQRFIQDDFHLTFIILLSFAF